MSYWRLFYHLVLGTEQRLPSIGAAEETFLMRVLPGIVREQGGMTHAVGIMPDHVHMVMSIPPSVAVSVMINRLKGTSSHMLSHEFSKTHGTDWSGLQKGYGALSFSERSLPSVVQYVTHQKERHAVKDLYQGMERAGEADEPEI